MGAFGFSNLKNEKDINEIHNEVFNDLDESEV